MAREDKHHGPKLEFPLGASKNEVISLVLRFRGEFDSMLRFVPSQSKEAFLQEHIWRCLPRNRRQLAYLLDCMLGIGVTGRDSPFFEVQNVGYAKLAALICEPNPWRLRRRTLEDTEEIQQLWPLWDAKLTRAIRVTFSEDLEPRVVSTQLREFASKTIRPIGLKMCWMMSRSDEDLPAAKWHAHGIVWPMEGDGIHKTTFSRRIKRLEEYLKREAESLKIIGRRIERIRNFPAYVNYLGKNLDEGKRMKKLPGEKGRLFKVPLVYKPPFLSESSSGNVKWEEYTAPERPSEFYREYHKERAIIAQAKGRKPDDPTLKFTRRESFLIYQKLSSLPATDLPRKVSIRGRDGHLYSVRGLVSLFAGEPLYFHLVRMLPGGKTVDPNGPTHECNITQLDKLSKWNVTGRCPVREDVCPITGRSPSRAGENFLNTIARAKVLSWWAYQRWKIEQPGWPGKK